MAKKKKLTPYEIERMIARGKKRGRVIRQKRVEKRKESETKEIRLAEKAEDKAEDKALKASERENIARTKVRVRRLSDIAKVPGRIFKERKFKKSRKVLTSRSKRFGELAKAFGAMPGKASGAGAGRPKGSYKYKIGGKPVSVFAWRKFMAQRKQQLAQFQAQQNQRLERKGFQPEQIQQLRQHHVAQRVQQGKPMMEDNVADQELAFREHLARNTVSPRTQQILVALRRTQNKAKADNIEQQRRHHERNMVGRAMNMTKAHENLVPVRLDFTGVNPEENILMAPSVFREDPKNNILRPRRRNILDMQENNLRFFG